MINVTMPFLPPKEEFNKLTDGIWKRNWLTNNGPLVNDLELNLKRYLEIDHLLYLTNGTIALQIAIRALDLKGEIITTPFSYVATTSSIVWEGCTPIFVDIDPESLNIDSTKIENAITENTSAILATHVYGNPCNISEIEKIAKKYSLKVIYDAAHCFGTKYKGKSVLEYGDISTISFHATKLFHTIEGGAVITKDSNLLKKMSFLRNFGHNGPESFETIGINGKNSEFHAAMGLCNLKYVDDIINKRKTDSRKYDVWLDRKDIKKINIKSDADFNYAYYPVIFRNEQTCKDVFEELKKYEIYARRYFYPLLSDLNYIRDNYENELKNANSISKRILCLPLYFQLSSSEIDMICRIILRVLNN